MGRYILKRLLLMIPVLLCVAIFIFTLMYFVPGDPAQILLGESVPDPETLALLREKMGLNKGYFGQLWDFLKALVRLDLGESYILGRNVSTDLIARFPYTLKLSIYSMILVVIIGIPLGVVSAINAGKLWDRIVMVVTLFLNSMPNFWLGLLLIVAFSVKLRVLPSSGVGHWYNYILPVVAVSVGVLASIARQTRSSMLEVVRADYVTTARSKGLSERKVIYGHALPNALIPIITVCGSRFAYTLGGSTVIESVFSIPGIGKYMVEAVNSRDYPIVRGSILFIAIAFSLTMLLVDILYAFADPRIKAQYAKKKR